MRLEKPPFGICGPARFYHDYKTNTIRHENVRMHVLGSANCLYALDSLIRIPSVDRRSGLVLMPAFKFSEDLGTVVKNPLVFVVVDETSDVEVIPNMTANRGNVLETRYRKLWDKTDLDASIYTGDVSTFEKNREFVAAADVKMKSEIRNNWKVNLNFKRSSQDTFLRRYDLNNDTAPKSEFSGSKTTNNSFYNVEFSEVQNLTDTSANKNSPKILPSITFEQTSKGFIKNQELTTKMHANQVSNDLGHDISRWNIQQTAVTSHETDLGIIDSEIGYLGSFYQINKRR
jgi:LPS-assembly protein